PPVYIDMTVTEYLTFVAQLKEVKKSEIKNMITDIMDKIKITHVSGKLIKNLSKGYRQRVGLAQALVVYPDVLILDEPTVGLDPKQIIEIRDVIRELSKEHTIILSSHILSEISAVCNRVMIINKGEIVASDTPESLSEKLSQNRYRTRLKGSEEEIKKSLSQEEGIIFEFTESDEEGTVDIFVEGTADIRESIFNFAQKNNFIMLGLKSEKMSLEEVFLQVTENTTENLTTEEGEASEGDL
ncbi:MAG: ATP-binding cassette domain-containing protein, partial [Anaerotignaceae bacterium]